MADVYSYVVYFWQYDSWGDFLKSSQAYECDFDCMASILQKKLASFDYEPEPISVFIENQYGEMVHSWDYYLDEEYKEIVWKFFKPHGD